MASETARNPALKDVIEKKCATCHTPMAETQAETLGTPVALSADGFLNPMNPLHEAGQDGVSCSLCHQIQPEDLGKAESFSGGYAIDTSTEPPDGHVRPLRNPVRQADADAHRLSAHVR